MHAPSYRGVSASAAPAPSLHHSPSTSTLGSASTLAPAASPAALPRRLNLYTAGRWSPHFVLGPHRDQPLHYVTSPASASGAAAVVVHRTADPASAPLAEAVRGGSDDDVRVRVAGVPRLALRAAGGLSRRFAFDAPAAAGGRFEWRGSRGAAVRALRAARAGWKLVWVPGGGGDGKEEQQQEEEEEVEGEEEEVVVAACAPVTGTSLSKVLCFEFVGPAAEGLLGPSWQLLAVLTGLAVWNLEGRVRATAGGATFIRYES